MSGDQYGNTYGGGGFYNPAAAQFDPAAGYSGTAGQATGGEAWFSDPSTSSIPAYPQVGNLAPVAPLAGTTTARPLTSIGFEPPAADGFGSLGGSLSNTKPLFGGPSSSRFGISTLEGEPPLLVELGIDFTTIMEKTKSALLPNRTLNPALMSDGDLAGPFVFCFSHGFLLMLAGKIQFGYVFGFGVMGCIAIYTVLNLLTQKATGIELHVVFSVLGYALLPIIILAAIAVLLPLKGMLGGVLVPLSVGYCTLTATRFFEVILAAPEQRYLIAYPAFLFFACFALITVF